MCEYEKNNRARSIIICALSILFIVTIAVIV